MLTNGFQRLPCVFGINVIDLSLQLQDLFSLDSDISGLTLDMEQNTHQRLPFLTSWTSPVSPPARLISD